MISKDLEQTLCKALDIAKSYQHEYATVEHLLLSLIEDGDAVDLLTICGAQIDTLSTKLHDFFKQRFICISQ